MGHTPEKGIGSQHKPKLAGINVNGVGQTPHSNRIFVRQ